MNTDQDRPLYLIWDPSENQAGNALEMPQFVSRIKANLVKADTWIYQQHKRSWTPAGDIPEMQMLFRSQAEQTLPQSHFDASENEEQDGMNIKLGSLRQISLLSGLDDDQLMEFVQFMEILTVPPFRKIVARGETGDAMYLILEGEVRACVEIDGKETTLNVINGGKFFGELSILDQAPRASDVVTNKETVLIKISADSFQQLVTEHPNLALPFLYALGKSLAGRLRNSNKQFEDSIHLARAAASVK